MMIKTIASALFAAGALFAISSGAQAATWDGQYAGTCDGNEKLQCTLDLKTGADKRVTARVIVVNKGVLLPNKCEVVAYLSETKGGLKGIVEYVHIPVEIAAVDGNIRLTSRHGKPTSCGIHFTGDYSAAKN